MVVGSLTSLSLAGCATRRRSHGQKMTAGRGDRGEQDADEGAGGGLENVQDKAKAGQIEALSPDAEKLASTAKEIPSLFPEGSLDPDKSAAKPEIWQKRAEFDAAAKNLETWSMKLRDASAANNTEQTQAIMKDFGRQACGTCHTALPRAAQAVTADQSMRGIVGLAALAVAGGGGAAAGGDGRDHQLQAAAALLVRHVQDRCAAGDGGRPHGRHRPAGRAQRRSRQAAGGQGHA